MKISAETRKLIRQEFARAGGKARAKKYDAATLSKWAAKGGRPRKDQSQDQQNGAASREKGRRK